MNELLEVIKNRRSVRHFTSQEVPADKLELILEAVRWAPSWTNCQCWEVVIVRDPSTKKTLQASFPPKGNPATKAIVDAPVVLALCAKTGVSGFYKEQAATKFGDWMMYDLGLATQNLCLMAHNLGLGTVIAGLFDHDQAREAINVPDGYELVSLIPLGYPAKTGSAPKRRDIHAFIHDEHF